LQKSIGTSFAGSLNEVWPYIDMSTLEYRENIDRQMRVVMLHFFAFKWFEVENRGAGGVTKLALKDFILQCCNTTCNYIALVKNTI